MKQLFKDITTTKDGQSFDIGRVAMAIVIATQPLVLLWALTLATISFWTGKPFDMRAALEADMYFLGGLGTFLLTSAYGLHLKRSTEPNES